MKYLLILFSLFVSSICIAQNQQILTKKGIENTNMESFLETIQQNRPPSASEICKIFMNDFMNDSIYVPLVKIRGWDIYYIEIGGYSCGLRREEDFLVICTKPTNYFFKNTYTFL